MTTLIMKLVGPVHLGRNKICYSHTMVKCFCLVQNSVCRISAISLSRQGRKNIRHVPELLTLNTSRRLQMSAVWHCEPDGSTADTEDVIFPITGAFTLEEHSEQFRNTLYPNSSDTLIMLLKSCNSIKHLLTIMSENLHCLKPVHYCQFILVMWDLVHCNQAVTDREKFTLPLTSISANTDKNTGSISSSEIRHILLNGLECIASNSESLNADALVCSILYSNRLSIELNHPVIKTLFNKINNLLDQNDINEFSASALSRLTISLSEVDELWAKLILIKALPLIYKYFDTCSSVEDFRALSISMLSTMPYLRQDFLVQYEGLTEELLRHGILTKDQTSVIVKVVLLLSNIYHKPSARLMIYKLLKMLQYKTESPRTSLFLPHFHYLQKIVKRNVEPHHIVKELENIKNSQLQLLTATVDTPPQFIHLFSVPPNPQGSAVLKELIKRSDKLDSLLCLQGQLTTAYPEACDKFWLKVAKLISAGDGRVDSSTLLKVCLRYIKFVLRMGSYYNRHFESEMLSLVARELVEGGTVHRPRDLAVLAAFVLAFDRPRQGAASLSADLVPHLVAITSQFNTDCCLVLSLGLKIGLHSQRNKELHLYLQLDTAFNERTREILKTEKDNSLTTFNVLLRSFINRKSSLESDLLWDILKRLEDMDWSQLTSRSLRNLVYNFFVTNTLLPKPVDLMVEYCLENRKYILGDTAGKLAHLCYSLGYNPSHANPFCEVTAELVTRDSSLMNGLSLLQVALALSYFNSLPSSLINHIFTVKFLEKLDTEIKNCFAKDKYPLRVRQVLMQLNRSVCLDKPEADVPWFHSKFCEEQRALGQEIETSPNSLFFTDVYSTLSNFVGQNYIDTGAYTPYGYSVDILLNLDKALNPIPTKEKQTAVHKLAILLHHDGCHTIGERRLKGYYQLKQRHLEILGYRVISLSDHNWNSMFMTEHKAKTEYLQNLIWPDCARVQLQNTMKD